MNQKLKLLKANRSLSPYFRVMMFSWVATTYTVATPENNHYERYKEPY